MSKKRSKKGKARSHLDSHKKTHKKNKKKYSKQPILKQAEGKPKIKRLHGKEKSDLKLKIYTKDQGMCQSPLTFCEYKAPDSLPYGIAELDHIIPIAHCGDNHHTNLRLLCPLCHALRKGPEHEARRVGMVRQGTLSPDLLTCLW